MSTFQAMGLRPTLLQALADLGFEQPTAVQAEAIPFVLSSERDLVALAQTGTGKTAAFSLPILQKLDPTESHIQALVLCPTRELCLQITNDIAAYTRHEAQLKSVAVYGGASIVDQIRQIKRGASLVVGTPGRVRDLIQRGKLHLDQLQFLVLDEADEMLTMGFKDELDAILGNTPAEKQTLLFSATMPTEIDAIANNYMRDPHHIELGGRNQANADVKHVYCVARSSDRYLALKRIIDMAPDIYGIVFCRTRAETKEVADWLLADQYAADALHGDLSQAQRDYVMGRFRKKNIQLLVATDVAARGIDVNDLTHVLHYKLPDQLENYIHRSGRTGRAGKKGMSIALISSKQLSKIRLLEKKIGLPFERRLIPTGEQVCERRLYALINKIATTPVDESVEPFMDTVYEQLQGLSKETILQRFVSLEFERFSNYYKDAGDLNQPLKKDRKKRERATGRSRGAMAKFYVNVGRKHRITAPKIIGLVNDLLRNKQVDIGKIDILKGFSTFEIDPNFGDQLAQAAKSQPVLAGVPLVIERTTQRAETEGGKKRTFHKGGGFKGKKRRGGKPFGKKGGKRRF